MQCRKCKDIGRWVDDFKARPELGASALDVLDHMRKCRTAFCEYNSDTIEPRASEIEQRRRILAAAELQRDALMCVDHQNAVAAIAPTFVRPVQKLLAEAILALAALVLAFVMPLVTLPATPMRFCVSVP